LKSKEKYFKKGTKISDAQKRYCRCVLHVSSKNSRECNIKKSGKGCVNPYAACRKNIKSESKYCAEDYDFKNIPDKELISFAELHWPKIPIPEPYSRTKMLRNLNKWKKEYKSN